jgi:hypothetical protein
MEEDRQHNDQQKKDKRTSNNPQNIQSLKENNYPLLVLFSNKNVDI